MRSRLMIGALVVALAACGSAPPTANNPPLNPPAPATIVQATPTNSAATDEPVTTPVAPVTPATGSDAATPSTPAQAEAATAQVSTVPPDATRQARQDPATTAVALPTLRPAPTHIADLTLTAPAQSAPSVGQNDGQAELPAGLFERLRDHLAAQTGGDPATITMAGAEAVVWNDGSLGCPQPGITYTQEPVAGYRVLLQTGGQVYDYRVGPQDIIVVCG